MTAPIRLATPADALTIAAIYAPICRDTAISFELEAPDAAEMARRIEDVLKRWPWLVYDEGGEVLGYGYVKPFRERAAYQWTLEASIYTAERARGRGVASALYSALFALAEALGYCSVVAGITLPNPASVALHERFGFQYTGKIPAAGYKLGAWHDVGYWCRPLRDLAGPPPAPLALDEVLGTPTWDAAIAAANPRI
jgi:phosphinothricin acetyltransferase